MRGCEGKLWPRPPHFQETSRRPGVLAVSASRVPTRNTPNSHQAECRGPARRQAAGHRTPRTAVQCVCGQTQDLLEGEPGEGRHPSLRSASFFPPHAHTCPHRHRDAMPCPGRRPADGAAADACPPLGLRVPFGAQQASRDQAPRSWCQSSCSRSPPGPSAPGQDRRGQASSGEDHRVGREGPITAAAQGQAHVQGTQAGLIESS